MAVPTDAVPAANNTAKSCTVNLNDLFEQAYTFSASSSWYKHLWTPFTANVFLKPTVDLGYTLEVQLFEQSRTRQTDLNAIHEFGATPLMLQFTKRYPVILTSDLGGHDGKLLRRARYMFDKYLWFLKKHGVAEANAVDLPPYNEQTMKPLDCGDSISLRGIHYHYEKWRMIGELVHAACNLARDLEFEVVDELPYPINCRAWDYLRQDELEN